VDDIKAEAMDARIADARKAFRAQSKLDKTLLDNIDGAIDKVAGDNPELRLAFYRHYSSSDLQSWTGGKPGDLGDTSNGDSKIKQDLLALQGKGHNWKTDDIESLLASTLVHELTHTPQGGRSLNPIDMVIPEGKAYGVESFFAERMGDRARERFIDDRYGGNDPLDNKAGGKLAFEKSYATMRELYRVIDGGQTNLAALAGVTPERARELAAEFITRNEDGYSRELKALYKEVYRP
jgi:hypothetical protein